MATHEYVLDCIKSTNIYPQNPTKEDSTSTGGNINLAVGKYVTEETESLVEFDRTQLEQIKSESITSVKIRLYIKHVVIHEAPVSQGTAHGEFRAYITCGKLNAGWGKTSYNSYTEATGTSYGDYLWNLLQFSTSSSSSTAEIETDADAWYESLGSYAAVDIDAITSCTRFYTKLPSGTGGLFYTATPEGGTAGVQLVVTTQDTHPNAAPISPIGDYKDSSRAITFEWSYEDDTGGSQASYELQYIDSEHADWTDLISGTSSDWFCTVPANTFAAGEVQWRVRVTNGNATPATSEWSAAAVFIAQGAPSAPTVSVISSPRPLIKWVATGQVAYRVKIDGAVTTQYGTAHECKVKQYLDDGTHTVAVSVQNAYGLWSEWSEASFIVENTSGAAITLAVTAENYATAKLTWDGDYTLFYVYRNGELIGKTDLKEFADSCWIGSAEYQVRGCDGDNYTRSNTASVTLETKDPILTRHDCIDWVTLKMSTSQSRTRTTYSEQDASYVYYAGRELPTLETSGRITQTFTFDAAFTDEAQAAKVRDMLGSVVVYKDSFGRLATGALMTMTRKDSRFYTAYQLSIRRIDLEADDE